jgi:membrane-associated phospholipid phosphatase
MKVKKNKQFYISIFFMLVLQMITYALVKLFQTNYHTFNYSLDNKIPFIPQMIIIYNLFYPMIFITFHSIYKKDKQTFNKGIIAAIIGYIIADIIFIIYPVEMIRPDITNLHVDPITRLIITLTYNIDSPAINCFPSIHCIYCMNCIYTIIKTNNLNKRSKIIYIITLSLIILSVLIVKQHYIFDILSALIIVIISNIISNFIYKKK